MPKNSTDVPVPHETAAPAPARMFAPAPWMGLGSLRDEMERLFDAFEPRHWFDRADTARTERGFPLCPAIDLTEDEKGYAVSAELPGLEADAIQIKISNGTLSISGEKSEEKTEGDANHHLSERRWGSFQRTIRMPENVDQDKIEATFSKGVLTVQMPKSAAALASEKTIAVKAA